MRFKKYKEIRGTGKKRGVGCAAHNFMRHFDRFISDAGLEAVISEMKKLSQESGIPEGDVYVRKIKQKKLDSMIKEAGTPRGET